jgi:uncharacterized protein (TIGR03067 family)
MTTHVQRKSLPALGLASCLGIASWLASGFATAQPASGDKELLQGAWSVVSGEAGGKKMPAKDLQGARVIFAGDVLLIEPERFTYKLDPAQKPKALDLVKGRERRNAIYELEGEQLKLAFHVVPGLDRPRAFTSPAGSKHVLLILKRDISPEGKEQVRKVQAEEAEREAKAKRWREWPPAQRQSVQNLRQIGVAMHAYLDKYGRFPPAAARAKDGKPLLSWRVLLLPFLKHDALYQAFKLDEPWDGPHNQKLLAQIPNVYAPMRDAEGHTPYQVLVGPGTMFESTQGPRFEDLRPNGSYNTIMVVEGADFVPWTKPADLVYDPQKPLPKLGGFIKNGFNVPCHSRSRGSVVK